MKSEVERGVVYCDRTVGVSFVQASPLVVRPQGSKIVERQNWNGIRCSLWRLAVASMISVARANHRCGSAFLERINTRKCAPRNREVGLEGTEGGEHSDRVMKPSSANWQGTSKELSVAH